MAFPRFDWPTGSALSVSWARRLGVVSVGKPSLARRRSAGDGAGGLYRGPGMATRLGGWIGQALVAAVVGLAGAAQAASFQVSFPATAEAKPIDGRIILLISTNPKSEPRTQ